MNEFSRLPAVDRLLAEPVLQALINEHGRRIVTDAVRAELAATREALRAGAASPSTDDVIVAVQRRIFAQAHPRLQPVFNLTGTVLH
ncbi:MAG: L-seryl-tRNA(Sec) selenium transferase, partial [Anaerolineae bacterium]|nr:L-seryl-tRNA(Sec) selenium transferase [Anaerolineae bacterium]